MYSKVDSISFAGKYAKNDKLIDAILEKYDCIIAIGHDYLFPAENIDAVEQELTNAGAALISRDAPRTNEWLMFYQTLINEKRASIKFKTFKTDESESFGMNVTEDPYVKFGISAVVTEPDVISYTIFDASNGREIGYVKNISFSDLIEATQLQFAAGIRQIAGFQLANKT